MITHISTERTGMQRIPRDPGTVSRDIYSPTPETDGDVGNDQRLVGRSGAGSGAANTGSTGTAFSGAFTLCCQAGWLPSPVALPLSTVHRRLASPPAKTCPACHYWSVGSIQCRASCAYQSRITSRVMPVHGSIASMVLPWTSAGTNVTCPVAAAGACVLEHQSR